MEENKEEYLDLTKNIIEEPIKKPIEELKEIVEPIKIKEVIEPIIEKKEKSNKKKNLFLILTFILVILSLSVNGFVLYKGIELFGNAQWLVSANVCTSFDKQIWIENHCVNQEGIDVCGFKDGYKNIILSLEQVKQISETDLLFCSEYSPYGETFVRLVEGYTELEGGIK